MKLLWLLILCPILSFGQCILSDQITANPAPVGGLYLPGTVVTFTYTISSYQGLSVNWMHGIAINAGLGWTAVTPVGTPTNNSGNGTWLWVNSVTSSATGITVSRPGWFYDSRIGGPPGPLDGNPGNNYGDGLTGPWTFRWRATVVGCPPGQDGATLSLIIENYADGETGSWINYDCQSDPSESFQAILDCCQPFVTGQILHN